MLHAGNGQGTTELRVDAHVHLYPFMSVEATLDAAHRNLLDRGTASQEAPLGVLLVADPDGVHGWERCADVARAGRWQQVAVDDGCVRFRHAEGGELALVSGRQLVSREGLEVLGTGCRGPLASGAPLGELVECVRASGGIAILAWGVGKWLGRRGRVVDGVIADAAGHPDVMLADNAGRPRLWSRVPQFEAAARSGLRVVAGTDPLPLPGEERRIGSYGIRLRTPAASGDVVAALRTALARPDVPVEIIGRRVTARDFAAGQLRLRLHAGTGRREAP